MATVKVKGLPGVQANIKRILDETRKDPKLLKKIGELTVEQIQGFTRSGKSIETGSSFKRLSREWVEARKGLSKHNSTSEFFLGSSKSNLTFTGALLNSIKFKVFPGAALVRIDPEDTHPGYKTGSGSSSGPSNKKLFEYLAKGGRGVFNFGTKFQKRLSARVNVLFKKSLRDKIRSGKI